MHAYSSNPSSKEVNYLSSDLQRLLRKKQYNFGTAEQIVKSVNDGNSQKKVDSTKFSTVSTVIPSISSVSNTQASPTATIQTNVASSPSEIPKCNQTL